MTFAQDWWNHQTAKSKWEDDLDEYITDYEKIGTDWYDSSLEIYGVSNDVRLNLAAQTFIRDSGFAKVYLNHEDGWETHYTWGGDRPFPVVGWRRRYVSDATATTTNVIVGEENPGYYEISFWPEGWTKTEWLETGYMRIVPDTVPVGIDT